MSKLNRLSRGLRLLGALWVAIALCGSVVAAPPVESVKSALKALENASKQSGSNVLIVWHDGEIVSERYAEYEPDQFYETMSATKGVVALAVGLLLQEGKIKSLDQPVADFYPEWRQGRKAKITIRHLMAHTSGLQNLQTTTPEIYPSPDFVKLALSAELSSDPGEHWSYNNKAVNLIAGIVYKASGMPMDDYMKTRLFDAIGLLKYEWVRDAAGNPHGMSGFRTSGRDLLKLGVFVLNRGKIGDRQLIAPEFFDELAKPGAPNEFGSSGHLWWLVSEGDDLVIDDELLERMRHKSLNPAFIAKIATIKGVYPEAEDPKQDPYDKAMIGVFGQNFTEVLKSELGGKMSFPKVQPRNVVGFAAKGSFGQNIIVIPQQKLVIVRLVGQLTPGFDEMKSSFGTLDAYAVRLTQAYRRAAQTTAGR